MRLWVDTETFSQTPIRSGTYRYVQDSELLLVTWAVDDGPVNCWDVSNYHDPEGLSKGFTHHLAEHATEVWAHNAMFDRNVLRRHGIDIPLHKWRCNMVKALAHALPAGLSKLCEVLNVPTEHAKLGKDPMLLFCTPRPKTSKLRRATRNTHPEEWERFIAYAKADVTAMRECHKRMPSWNYENSPELALWHLDQTINDRGFEVDLDLANAAIAAVDAEQIRLAAQTHEMTGGEVASTTQRDALLTHILAEYGIDLPDMTGGHVEKWVDDPDLPQELRDLLAVRLQASTTSTAKYRALINGAT